MAFLFIHARNSSFRSRDEGAHYDSVDAALAIAVRGAMFMLADEVERGERSAAIEVWIMCENGTELRRSVVAVSVAPLLTDGADTPEP